MFEDKTQTNILEPNELFFPQRSNEYLIKNGLRSINSSKNATTDFVGSKCVC